MQQQQQQRHYARRTHAENLSAKTEKGVKVCTSCRAIYQKRFWQHDSEEFRSMRIRKAVPVQHVLCPACKMISQHKYEGKIVIKDVPSHYNSELINLILASSKKARHYNPEHRLIEVVRDEKDIILTTTEDQLAVQLAKKVRDVFKRVKLNIHYRKQATDATMVWVKFEAGQTPALSA